MSKLWKVLRLVSFILSGVLQAEDDGDAQTGAVKHQGVLSAAVLESQALDLSDGIDVAELKALISALIDAIVGIANIFGAFQRSPT